MENKGKKWSFSFGFKEVSIRKRVSGKSGFTLWMFSDGGFVFFSLPIVEGSRMRVLFGVYSHSFLRFDTGKIDPVGVSVGLFFRWFEIKRRKKIMDELEKVIR